MPDLPGQIYLTRPQVAVRFSTSERTISRWQADPGLGFPRSLLINGRHFIPLDQLEEWERHRAAASRKAA